MSRAPTIPRFPDVPGLAKYLEDLSRWTAEGQANRPGLTRLQPYSGNLQALADLVGAADKLPYFIGPEAMALTGLTAAGRALIDDADAAAQRATLGLGTVDVPDFADLVGVATNSNAAVGNIGEIVLASIASGSSVALVNNVAKDIANISLGAGDWDVYGSVYFNPNVTAAITYILGSLSLTTNTSNLTEGQFAANQYAAGTTFASASRVSLQMAARFSFNATTSIFLVGMSTFATAANTAYGSIWARRAR